MKPTAILLSAFIFFAAHARGQVYFTKNGDISFFSKGLLEDIRADNNQVISVINSQTGELQFSLLNDAFEFKKAKMQADFNENYMESDRFPRSSFKGTIANVQSVNFAKDGTYPVSVTGSLTIHGDTRSVTLPATLLVQKGTLSGKAVFQVRVKDYGIAIPTIVSRKIAETIDITVNCIYQEK